jgi:peptide/nickel transport system substrate-binding protein
VIDFFKKIFSKKWEIGALQSAEKIVKNFSPAEKTIFGIFVFGLFFSTLFLLIKLNDSFMVEIPTVGGTVSEGIVGSPRFINPILALNDADRDLTELIYSGLLKATSDGRLSTDLASDYNISDDGLVYTFNIKENAKFQDGANVTADDVVFTIKKIQDPAVKSPKRASFDGVLAEKTGDKQIKFTLKKPYSPFLENTTIGILPKHLWKDATSDEFPFSQLNIEPIGSGPYKIAEIKRDSSGLPTSYLLNPFEEYTLGEPYVKNLILKFYTNSKNLIDGYNKGEIDAISAISPSDGIALKEKGVRLEKTPLPRIFGLFFNQNEKPIFAEKAVRQALNISVDKNIILKEIFGGYGTIIDGPIPVKLAPEKKSDFASLENFSATTSPRIDEAKKLLKKSGWTENKTTGMMEKISTKDKKTIVTEFAFSISTVNTTELKNTALMLKEMWKKIGANVDVKIFEAGDLNQNVIRARKYDTLLFGEIIGRDLDLYAFWHSSQRNDPGLNIASYTNSKADKILEEIRAISNYDKRAEKLSAFETEIKNDTPAVFLYSPDFLYVVPKQVKGFNMNYITIPSERFLNIQNWYINTEKVWKIFAKDKTTI